MFRAHVLIIRRSKLYYTASGIITPNKFYFMSLHVPSTCARNMYRHEIKLIVKQILCINLVKYWDKYTEMHDQQNVKIQHRISGCYPKVSKRMENCWNVTMLLNVRKKTAVCRSNYLWNKLHSELTKRCMVKSTERTHGSNGEKSRKYQLLATYFNIFSLNHLQKN